MELNKTELLFKRFHDLRCANFCTVMTLNDEIDPELLEGAFLECINDQVYPELTFKKRPLSQAPHIEFRRPMMGESMDRAVEDAVFATSYPITVLYEGNRLAVIFQHYMADGRSSMVFLNQVLMTYYALTDSEVELSTYDKPLVSKYVSHFKIFHIATWLLRYFANYVLKGIARFPKEYDKKTNSQSFFVRTMTLAEEDNQAVADQCVEEGISYTAKLAAKYMLAVKKHFYEGRNVTVAVLVAVDMNLRRMNVLRCDTSFMLLKHRFSKLRNESIEASCHRRILNNLESEYPVALFQAFPPKAFLSKAMMRVYMMFQHPAFMLTNYGNLNGYLSEAVEAKIDALYSFVPPGVNTVFTLTTYTFKGVMYSASAGYGSCVSVQTVEDVHAEIVSTLRV